MTHKMSSCILFLRAGSDPTSLCFLVSVLLWFRVFCLFVCLFCGLFLMGPLTGLCIGPLPVLLRLSTCRRPCMIIYNSSFCCGWTCVTTWRKPWRRWTEKKQWCSILGQGWTKKTVLEKDQIHSPMESSQCQLSQKNQTKAKQTKATNKPHKNKNETKNRPRQKRQSGKLTRPAQLKGWCLMHHQMDWYSEKQQIKRTKRGSEKHNPERKPGLPRPGAPRSHRVGRMGIRSHSEQSED